MDPHHIEEFERPPMVGIPEYQEKYNISWTLF
jgi:hypothetical protein